MNICLQCKSDKTSFAFEVKDMYGELYFYSLCKECGVVFLDSLPTDEQTKKAYSDTYYGTDSDEKFSDSVILKMISFFSRKRAKRLSNLMPIKAKILDVGCGNGRFLEHLSNERKQYNLHGIEIDTKAALRANRRLNEKAWIHTVSDLSENFAANSLDAISCIHVFEHTTEPVKMLNDFVRLLKPGGICLIVIPNIDSVQYRVFKKKWFHLDPPRHIHFYPPQLLQDTMKQQKCSIIYSNTFDIEQNPFGTVQSILNVLCKQRDVLYERLKGNDGYATKHGRLSIFMMKLFWISVFPFAVLSDMLLSVRRKGACIEMVFRKDS